MTTTSVNNGVNVEALLEARKALAMARRKPPSSSGVPLASGRTERIVRPAFGAFTVSVRSNSTRPNSLDADHPEIFASEDHGVTPIEFVLVGLASCLTAGVAAVAQNRGIQLRSVEANLEGAMDIQGILGMDSDIRNGYDDIKVTFTIDADASPQEIEALVAPVAETIGSLRCSDQSDERNRRSQTRIKNIQPRITRIRRDKKACSAFQSA